MRLGEHQRLTSWGNWSWNWIGETHLEGTDGLSPNAVQRRADVSKPINIHTKMVSAPESMFQGMILL